MLCYVTLQSVSPSFVSNTHIVRHYPESHPLKQAVKNSLIQPQDIADGVIYTLSTPPDVLVRVIFVKR